jgi:hypothetical protein
MRIRIQSAPAPFQSAAHLAPCDLHRHRRRLQAQAQADVADVAKLYRPGQALRGAGQALGVGGSVRWWDGGGVSVWRDGEGEGWCVCV